MKANAFDDLLERALEGSASPDDLERLTGAAAADEELGRRMDRVLAMDAGLRGRAIDSKVAVDALMERLTQPADADRFARTVRRRVSRRPWTFTTDC